MRPHHLPTSAWVVKPPEKNAEKAEKKNNLVVFEK